MSTFTSLPPKDNKNLKRQTVISLDILALSAEKHRYKIWTLQEKKAADTFNELHL